MLTIDPQERPSVDTVVSKLQALGEQKGLDLDDAAFSPPTATPEGKFSFRIPLNSY